MWSILQGDCVDVMALLPAESVDAVITSPPYAQQRKATYGGIPEAEYPAWTVAWMEQAKRVLKPDGSVVINIRPHIVKGQLSDYTLRTRLAVRDAGWCEVDELIWHKTNAMPVGARRKPRRSWESLHWFALHGQPFSDAIANGKPSTRATRVQLDGQHLRNGWSHYNVSASTTPAMTRCTDLVSLSKGAEQTGHPAPYPSALAEWVAKLVCPPGGTILDPFSGSASTGVAAIRNGYDYIGIDAMPEYVDMSRRRLEATEDAA